LRFAAGAVLLGAPRLVLAEIWDPAEVREAHRLQAEEAGRAADYRARVARGDVRAASAPMPRSAPQTPGEPLRDVADWVDRLERWLEGRGGDGPRGRRRDELRRREREQQRERAERWREEEERRRERGEEWWEEEERRLERGR
jgi:hypothetical protein